MRTVRRIVITKLMKLKRNHKARTATKEFMRKTKKKVMRKLYITPTH